MQVKHIRHYEDYREALEQWKTTTPSSIHSLLDNTYIVEWETTCNGTPDLMREFLLDIKLNYNLSQEEIDALAYADAAIKTLVDMGVLE